MSQFSIVPPLKQIAIFFKQVTGTECEVDATWTAWTAWTACTVFTQVDILEDFRPYYRPCHTKILDETASGLYKDPSRLLRQLLRPHGLTLQYRNKVWTLMKINAGLDITEATTVVNWT